MTRCAKGNKNPSELSLTTGASRRLMIAGLVWVSPAWVQPAAQALSSSPSFFGAQTQGEKRRDAAQGHMIHVVATLNLAKHTGAILQVTPITVARPRPALSARAELVARDAAGRELYRIPVAMQAPANVLQGRDQTALIDAA